MSLGAICQNWPPARPHDDRRLHNCKIRQKILQYKWGLGFPSSFFRHFLISRSGISRAWVAVRGHSEQVAKCLSGLRRIWTWRLDDLHMHTHVFWCKDETAAEARLSPNQLHLTNKHLIVSYVHNTAIFRLNWHLNIAGLQNRVITSSRWSLHAFRQKVFFFSSVSSSWWLPSVMFLDAVCQHNTPLVS